MIGTDNKTPLPVITKSFVGNHNFDYFWYLFFLAFDFFTFLRFILVNRIFFKFKTNPVYDSIVLNEEHQGVHQENPYRRRIAYFVNCIYIYTFISGKYLNFNGIY